MSKFFVMHVANSIQDLENRVIVLDSLATDYK